MNPVPPPADYAVDAQAARWAARLDSGEFEAADRAELDAWLARDPVHRAALADYCQFSADLEDRLPHLVAAGRVTLPAASRRPRRSFAAFAGIGLAAAVAVVLYVTRPAPQIENVATAVAQRHSHTLADGTRVELNAQTSLRFENTRTGRRVRLVGGEALFVVAKDAARPFVVETPAGTVRVTGTVFNLRTESGTPALDVTVVEGSVQVRPGEAAAGEAAANPVALGAGDHLSARRGRVTVNALSPAALADTLAWRNGRIVFHDAPLAEVAARFAHYHGRSITVDGALAAETLGGRYSLDDLGGFLAALEVSLPVKVRTDLSGAITLVRRQGR
jgi:transmembrane sensor